MPIHVKRYILRESGAGAPVLPVGFSPMSQVIGRQAWLAGSPSSFLSRFRTTHTQPGIFILGVGSSPLTKNWSAATKAGGSLGCVGGRSGDELSSSSA